MIEGAASIAALLAAGAAIGLLAGLLGIGGGVIAVPVLLEVFGGGDDGAALALGTAHGAVLLAALPALAAHRRAGAVDGALLRRWLPPMLAGAALGLAAGRILPSAWLVGSFALLALALALRLLARPGLALAAAPPAPPLGWLPPAAVGAFAAALGIGAGTLSGPVLALLSVPLPAAIGAGSAFNLVVALPATMLAGLSGHVVPIALALLVAPAFLVAPPAARLSRRLDPALLRGIFGLVLLAIALRMAWRALA